MKISESIPKLDHGDKIQGEARYRADEPIQGALYGKLLRSSKVRAKILRIDIPELPENCTIVREKDIPGKNRGHIIEDNTPVFTEHMVEYIGDPILMVVGPDPDMAARLRDGIRVEYEELEPVIALRDSDTAFYDKQFRKGG